MEFIRKVVPTGLMPVGLRDRLYSEQWQKDRIQLELRDHEDALSIKSRPIPYLEVYYKITNNLPHPLQIFGTSVEILAGKPIVNFYTFISDYVNPGETRESLRAYAFLNNYQAEILCPPKKDGNPPGVSLNLTISARSKLGMVEKTVKKSWILPRLVDAK